MGVTATTRLPAGWYPDPDGGNQRRWWDGREWTQYTAEFQRRTSVDELDLDQTSSAEKKPGKSAKQARRLRRVETAAIETVADATADAQPSRRRVTAERLGRWLAGAVHRAPALRKSGRGRRARRSAR